MGNNGSDNRFLIDTNVFIRLMAKSKPLQPDVRHTLADPQNKVFVSIITPWEIVLKKRLNLIKVSTDLKNSIEKAGFLLLPIEIDHITGLEKLPLHRNHKDPFDRLLISQAKIENLTLVTADPKMWRYDLRLLKA